MRQHVDRRHGVTDNPYRHFPPKAENPNFQKRVSSKESSELPRLVSPSLNPQSKQDNSMERSLWIRSLSKEIQEMSNFEFNFLLPVIWKRLLRPPY